MKTIQKCSDTLSQGSLVQWGNDGLLVPLTDGLCVGVVGEPFTSLVMSSLDGVGTEMVVAELTLHGPAKLRTTTPISRNGGALYLNGEGVTTEPNGQLFAYAMPRELGQDQPFEAGSLVDVLLV